MNEEAAADIARRLISAADMFREQNPYLDQARSGWSVWWNAVPEASELFSKAVQDVVDANPDQLSASDTANALTYHYIPSLATLVFDEARVNRDELQATVTRRVLQLAAAEHSRRLQLVVENIAIRREAPRFFGIDLVAPTQAEMQTLYEDQLIAGPQTNAIGLANFEIGGDRTMAHQAGVRLVERYLNLLRGCGADVMLGEVVPIRIIDRNPIVQRTAVREWTNLGLNTTAWIELGGRHTASTDTLLAELEPPHIERLIAISTGRSNRMESAALACLEMLGEASKPNLDTTRMLLASVALEIVLGERPNDDVSFRGLTAMVTERATFLVAGDSTEGRLQFDKRLRALYGKGSGVRHGGRPEVSTDDVVALARIARKVALTMLERPELTTTAKLDQWVQQMRYTTAPPPEAGG